MRDCKCGESWVEIEPDPDNGFDAYKTRSNNMELQEGSAYVTFHCNNCGSVVDKVDKSMNSFNVDHKGNEIKL